MAEHKRPNILLLVTDQQRYDTLSCNGSKYCRTPAADRIASEGVLFSRAYTCTSLCSPARASLLTGQFAHHHGVLSNLSNFNSVFARHGRNNGLEEHHPNLGRLLADAGYYCGFVGKWHITKNERSQFGFDHWFGLGEFYRKLKADGVDWTISAESERLEFGPDAVFADRARVDMEHFPSVVFADKTIEMIREAHSRGRPFFLFCCFYGPHFPLVVPPPYDTMVAPDSIKPWPNFHDDMTNKPRIHAKEKWRWNAEKLSWQDWQKILSIYFGFVMLIDAQVNRVLAVLDELGIADDTMTIFTTDHGEMGGAHGLFNKGFNMYEEAYHIPLVLRYPAGVEPRRCERFVSLVDLMPTVLDAAGVPVPEQVDGRSLLPLLRGRADDWPDDIYAQFHGYETTLYSQRMVRTEDFKYVYNPPDIDELYDLRKDPYELVNVIDDPAYAAVLEQMRWRLWRWMRRLGETPIEDCSYRIGPNPRVLGRAAAEDARKRHEK